MPRRLPAALSFAAVAVATVAVLSSPGATAGSQATVTVDNLTDGQVVAGDIAVTMTATPTPGAHLTGVEIGTERVEPTDYRYQWMSLTGCDVAVSCTGTVTVHTQDLANGPNTISLYVFDSTSGMVVKWIGVNVDNPKPTVSIVSPATGDVVWGAADVRVDARPADRADAHPIASVSLFAGYTPVRQSDGSVNYGTGPAITTSTTAPYTLSSTFGGTPRVGLYTVVVTDTAGNTAATGLRLTVHPGLTLSLGVGSGGPVAVGTPTYAYASAAEPAGANDNVAPNPPNFYLTDYQVAVDGVTAAQGTYVLDCPQCASLGRVDHAYDQYPVTFTAPGTHTVTYTVSDSFGVTTTTATTVEAIVPVVPAVLSSTASTAGVVTGHPVTLSTRLTRGDTTAALAGRTVTLQWQAAGATTWKTAATRTTSATGAASAAVTPSGTGTYRWVYAGETGYAAATSPARLVTVTVTVAVKVSATSIRYGTLTKVTATATPHESGTTLTLQRYDGTRWITAGTARESSTGVVTYSVKLPRGTWKLRVAKSATTRYGVSYSTTVTVKVS